MKCRFSLNIIFCVRTLIAFLFVFWLSRSIALLYSLSLIGYASLVLIPCSDIQNDFHIKTMFDSSLPPVVSRNAYNIYMYLRILATNTTWVSWMWYKKQKLLTIRKEPGSPLVFGGSVLLVIFSFQCCVFFVVVALSPFCFMSPHFLCSWIVFSCMVLSCVCLFGLYELCDFCTVSSICY